MSNVEVKQLESNSYDDWTRVYNQVMQRSSRFSPISGRILEKLVDYLKTHDVTFLVGYHKMQPSAACSYAINKDTAQLSIHDFCVLPVSRDAGVTMVDQILSQARASGCTRVSAWLPTTSTTSLDVLGEYLFTPGDAVSVMRCFLEKSPEDYDAQIIDLTSNNEESTLLPFQNPFLIQPLLESLLSTWKLSYQVKTEVEIMSVIELYLSNKMRNQAWLFPLLNTNRSVSNQHLSSALAFLYDTGVRDVLTEIKAGDYWELPFRNLGFERVITWFEVYFDIYY